MAGEVKQQLWPLIFLRWIGLFFIIFALCVILMPKKFLLEHPNELFLIWLALWITITIMAAIHSFISRPRDTNSMPQEDEVIREVSSETYR